MHKIIFVCTGNTCRSPMAAAMATDIFKKNDLTVEVLSAGVNAWGNQPASSHALMVMKESGLCLAAHTSTLVYDTLIESATLILSMTSSHQAALQSDYPNAKDKIYTLGEYVGRDNDISDPFGGTLQDYRNCAKEIRELLSQVPDKLKRQA